MKFFHFLIFCLLNPLTASQSRFAKRKISEIASSNTTTSAAAISETSQDDFQHKLLRNDGMAVFKIPADVIVHIAGFLNNPYKSMPFVSYRFWLAMKQLSPGSLLASRSSYPSLKSMAPSRELARLFDLNKRFLHGKFDQVFHIKSVFTPKSLETVNFVVSSIEATYLNESDINAALSILLNYLKAEKLYYPIFTLLQRHSHMKHKVNDPTLWISIILTILNNDPNELNSFKGIIDDNFLVYSIFSSLPFTPENFQILTAEEAGRLSPSFKIMAVSLSSTFGLPFELSENEKQIIWQRNFDIIESAGCEYEYLVHWAHLCNNLKYSKIPDEPIEMEFLNTLAAEHQNPLYERWTPKVLSLMYHEILIFTTIHGGYKQIFMQLVKLKKSTFKTTDLVKLLRNSPEFVQLLSPTVAKKIFGLKDRVFLLKNGKFTESQVLSIVNIYEKIRCFYELYDSELFREILVELFETVSFRVSQLIKEIAQKSDNPAVIINQILIAFKDHQFTKNQLMKIARAIGEPKHIQSLLEPGNEAFLTFPSDKYYVIIDQNNFMPIFEMADKLKAEHLFEFRSLFFIKWSSVFKYNQLHSDEIVKFFGIFGVHIGNFDLFTSGDYVDRLKVVGNIHKDSRTLFRSPHLLSSHVDEFIYLLARELYNEELILMMGIPVDQRNPFILKSYNFYKLWMDRNIETFIEHAPSGIIKMLVTDLSPSIIRNAVFQPFTKINLIKKILSTIIKEGTVIEIKIDNISDLRTFFHESFPYFRKINLKFRCLVRVNWEKIFMEASGNVINYEIIFSVIKDQEHALNTLKSISRKPRYLIDFLNYVDANLENL